MIFIVIGIFIDLTQIPAARAICGGQKKLLHEKNNGISIIITYPPNPENIFIICLQLGYSIRLHVLLNITGRSSSVRCQVV